MSGLLADLYSAGDRMKRKLGGLLSNPLETIALGSTRMAEDTNALTRLASEAGYMPNTVNRADQSVLVSERQKALARALLADKGAEMGANMVGATVWHGSPREFDSFSMSAPKTTGGAFNRYGVSVSENPKVAQRYASDFGKDGGFVYKVDAQNANPMNIDRSELHRLQTLVGEFDRKNGNLPELQAIALEDLLHKYGVSYQPGQHPIEAIKKSGFDSIRDSGVKARSGNLEQETLVFDPSLLKILERNGVPIK